MTSRICGLPTHIHGRESGYLTGLEPTFSELKAQDYLVADSKLQSFYGVISVNSLCGLL